MEQQGIRLHETNEGRETQQGIAGFEGLNALFFMFALGLAMLIFRKYASGTNPNMLLAIGLASIPLIIVSAYCFGLKQGKPPSYDVELGEWLIIKASKNPYFSPRQVEPMSLPWLTESSKEKSDI
ncbi:hypothetical protein SAMN02745166_04209 [Prosthecobacter debontii]|uniref:Uncharacterized protein n=1 Tax=Prosthecobacter debontii TaxID=48467 RepID=A0A1T4YVB2_9BACT|nr:hypothetical protein [Prosthecobacter debontii]SKB05231.1 hypothetical protein SAMN02745166_04209 [Prosthecobacter debontii]